MFKYKISLKLDEWLFQISNIVNLSELNSINISFDYILGTLLLNFNVGKFFVTINFINI